VPAKEAEIRASGSGAKFPNQISLYRRLFAGKINNPASPAAWIFLEVFHISRRLEPSLNDPDFYF
jgi:hypothetical protein